MYFDSFLKSIKIPSYESANFYTEIVNNANDIYIVAVEYLNTQYLNTSSVYLQYVNILNTEVYDFVSLQISNANAHMAKLHAEKLLAIQHYKQKMEEQRKKIVTLNNEVELEFSTAGKQITAENWSILNSNAIFKKNQYNAFITEMNRINSLPDSEGPKNNYNINDSELNPNAPPFVPPCIILRTRSMVSPIPILTQSRMNSPVHMIYK